VNQGSGFENLLECPILFALRASLCTSIPVGVVRDIVQTAARTIRIMERIALIYC